MPAARPPFDPQPVLAGDLVRLRPLVPSDWDALYAAARDPLIWEQHPERDRHEEPVFRRFFQSALDSGGAFVILDAATGAVIGSSRYQDYDRVTSQVEVGYTFLARRYWGGRYNRELKQLMLGHAFRSVDRVIFVVGEHNYRSQRALEKIGAVRHGALAEPDGRRGLVFLITADTFR